jgi:hypothetical protein
MKLNDDQYFELNKNWEKAYDAIMEMHDVIPYDSSGDLVELRKSWADAKEALQRMEEQLTELS